MNKAIKQSQLSNKELNPQRNAKKVIKNDDKNKEYVKNNDHKNQNNTSNNNSKGKNKNAGEDIKESQYKQRKQSNSKIKNNDEDNIHQLANQQQQQRKIGSKYGCIHYRDAEYHGKILMTVYKNTINNQIHNNNYSNNNIIASHFINTVNQYRDGPGILMLDTNVWIIGQWQKNKLVHGSNGKQIDRKNVYIITNQLNVIQVGFKNNGNGANISEEQFWDEEFIKKIQQLSYIGTLYSDVSKHQKQQKSPENIRTNLKRYQITGHKQSNTKQKHDIWKWMVNILQQISNNDNNNNNSYYYQTQHRKNDVENKNLQIKVRSKKTINTKDCQPNNINNCQYFIKRIKEILSFKKVSNQQQIKLVSEQKLKIGLKRLQNKTDNDSKPNTKNPKISTILINTFCNQQPYIKISTQQQSNQSSTNNTRQYHTFVIQQLGLLTKYKMEVNNTSKAYEEQNVNVTCQLDNYLYFVKYLYAIKYHQCLQDTNSKKTKTDINYNLEISEYYPNINKQQNKLQHIQYLKQIKKQQVIKNKQYKISQNVKKNYHLTSLNFIDKTHSNILFNVHQLIKIISVIENQMESAIKNDQKQQQKYKQQKEKQKQNNDKQHLKNKQYQQKNESKKNTNRQHYSKYVKNIVEKATKNKNKNNLTPYNQPNDINSNIQQQQQINTQNLTLLQLIQKYNKINKDLVLSAKKNHIPLAQLNLINRQQMQQKQAQLQQIQQQYKRKRQQEEQEKELQQQLIKLRKQQQAKMIQKQRQKMRRRNCMKSYNEYDIQYWQEDYSNENKLCIKFDKDIKKLLNSSQIKNVYERLSIMVNSINMSYWKNIWR